VPVVNIATPNAAGISHNRYIDFHVDVPGMVLNNATGAGLSLLTGPLAANPHFNGNSATVIINEVDGSSSTTLAGPLEVFGQQAGVIIANPHGLACDGCRFINASGITLTTGTPVLNPRGELERLNVTGGTITVGEKGFDGQSQDYSQFISRTLALRGPLHADQLDIILGVNQVDYQYGRIQPQTTTAPAPPLALNIAAPGSMYASRIRLVASEKGAGISAKNITSRQGDITLDVAGPVTLGDLVGYAYSGKIFTRSVKQH
jgi:filamentous hemagglutinin